MSAAAADRHHARLAELIAAGAARARRTGRPVLVSLAEPLPIVDPLHAFAELGRGGRAAGARETAAYWSRPETGSAFAAIGAALELTGTGAQRFAAADEAWRALLADAVVEDPSEGVEGAGPILTGGFSFEPDGPRTAAWRGFGAASLVLPRLQVAVAGGECWLTVNVVVEPDGTAALEPAEIARLRDLVSCAAAPEPSVAGAGQAAPVLSDVTSAARWQGLIAEAKAAIGGGAFAKVVLARAAEARAERSFAPVAAIRQLRDAYPSTFVFAFRRGARTFLGATPERLARLQERDVHSSSLAGSIRRGRTEAEDRQLMHALLASGKDRAEHDLVRTMLVEALGAVCDDVEAPEVPDVLTLPQVHHLHTVVRGRLRDGHSLLDVVARLHPTPAVGGAPRAGALRFIREHEQLDRGWYAAPVGWVGRAGGEFAVALRSAVVAGGQALLFAGCGIVADSDPAEEWEESVLKLRPMQVALAHAAVAGSEPPVDAPAAAGASR